MPVRFQVDPDFYDHPKSIGLSDAATALWVRAGSYSVAKLLDGFVPEHVLALLSRSPVEAADELVARGLWRRTKGGFQFHQWDGRNLTRARIEADRDYERERKRKRREQAKVNTNGHVKDSIVPPGHPSGHPGESDGCPVDVPPVSVSMSVSMSKDPPSPPRGKRAVKAYDYDKDANFQKFWAAYPAKAGKAAAFPAWRKALDRGVDPDVIISAAERYRDDPRRNPDKTKYPQGWLNDERYLDEVMTSPTEVRGWWDN